MYCSKCGNEIIEGSIFCSSCGNKIETITNNTINENNIVQNNSKNQIDKNLKTQNKKTKIIISIIIGIVAIGILVSGIVMINKGKNNDEIKSQYNEEIRLQYNVKYVYENMYITFFEDGTYTRNVEGITTANYTINNETKEIICKEIQNVDGYEMDLEMFFKYLNENEIQETSMKVLGIVPNGVNFGEIYSTNNTLNEKNETTTIQEAETNNNSNNIENSSSSNNVEIPTNSNNSNFNYNTKNDTDMKKSELEKRLQELKEGKEEYIKGTNENIAYREETMNNIKAELPNLEGEAKTHNLEWLTDLQSIQENTIKEQKEEILWYDKEIAEIQAKIDELK